MRFFHLSDLHIGLRLMNRDLGEDQAYILDRIVRYAAEEQPDAVVVAGDLFDRAVPSSEAVSLFDHFLSALSAALPEGEIMMISGNHDSAPRIDMYREILKNHRIRMIGMPPVRMDQFIEKVRMEDEYGPVYFYLLPFVKPSFIKQITGTDENGNNLSYDEALRRLLAREDVDLSARNVLVSHQFYLPSGTDADSVERADSEIRTVGNIDAVGTDVLLPFDYAALGHIHKPMKAGSEFLRYSGTPLPTSVSEAGQAKGIILVEMKEKGNISTSVLPLEPLRQIRVIRGTPDEVLARSCGDYVRVELDGDSGDMDLPDILERIRRAFPYLLEIRRKPRDSAYADLRLAAGREADPFELCCEFLGETDVQERELLRDVINHVEEVTV